MSPTASRTALDSLPRGRPAGGYSAEPGTPSPPIRIVDESAGISYDRIAPHVKRPPHADQVALRLVTFMGEERWEEAPAEDETTVLYWRVSVS